MTVERKVRGVERDVSFDETREPTISGAHERSQAPPTPKHSVMDQETVGVLLRRLADRGLAEVYGRGEPADVPRVADLQAVQRLGGVSDLLGDAEVFIEKTDKSV
jgi:hypothetical protein